MTVSSHFHDGRCGTFEEDRQYKRHVHERGQGADFQRGWILEHQIWRFAKMILRDRCSTSYDLASIFRGRRSTLDRWSGEIAKRIGTRLLSSFEGSLPELL